MFYLENNVVLCNFHKAYLLIVVYVAGNVMCSPYDVKCSYDEEVVDGGKRKSVYMTQIALLSLFI